MKRYWLAERRQELGLMQKDVAEAIGVEPPFYHLIEQGERHKRLPLDIVVKLSKVLKITVQEIIDREGIT